VPVSEEEADIDWAEHYKIAVGHLGIQPSQFWEMSPAEFYLLYDAKRDRDPDVDYAGGLDDNTLSDLWRDLKR